MTMERERLAELEKIARAATPGPWTWWTSNSWRRLRRDDRGIGQPVLEPFVARDGHPDLDVTQENMAHIAAFDPPTALALLSDLTAMREEIERLRVALAECADDLEVEIEARRGNDLARRIERDLAPVRNARAILGTSHAS